jgi:TPR repeat protein
MGMNRTFKATVAALTLAVSFAGSVAAGPYEDAAAAYARSDYATAQRLWRPLAALGDADAQFNLGYIYWIGQGVPKDFVLAYMWFNLAAASGGRAADIAAEKRNIVAAQMTPAQIAEAQKLAREWKPK